MRDPIYLDNQSTTPTDPRVRDAMAPFLAERYGHPASRGHAFGWDAEKGVERARAQVADLIGAEPREIVFTSGGTESDNLAIKGVAEALSKKGRHIVTTAVENRPVLDSCRWLETQGFEITRVAPDGTGRVAPEGIEAALREDTILVSVQHANQEVGTVQPIREIGALLADRAVIFHCDASHAAASLPMNVADAGVHLLSLTAHRMHGPMGVGALYVRRRKPRVRLAPQMHGGGHERGFRSGTANVAGIVGFGTAADLCRTELAADASRLSTLRNRLEAELIEGLPGVRVLGDPVHRLPGTSNLAIDGVEAEALLVALPDIALATGSACSSATLESSYVLSAMGVPKSVADTSVRISLGRFTTEAEIDSAIERILEVVPRIRALG